MAAPDPEAARALEEPAHARALALLKRYGWNSTSFQCLEPGFAYWFSPEGDACVAYVDTRSAWVAAGAPIAHDSRLRAVAEAFIEAARSSGRRACFFATERRFLRAAPVAALLIGEQPVWDPLSWEETLQTSRSLREQLRRARAKGVSVRGLAPEALTEEEHPRRRSLDRLIDRWLESRRLPPMGFLVQVYPFTFPHERRFFVAELDGRMVGFLAMVPVYARGGWLLEDLLRDADAPNGTAELLIDAAMRAAAEQGSRYATLGLAPLAGQVSGWLRAARRIGGRFYNFEGLRAFKARLRPHRWEPIYVAFPRGQSELLTIYDTLSAFARGGLLRYGLRSLFHSPDLVIRILTALLVPWTLLLALAAPESWFPTPWVRYAWVAFDLGLLVALVTLGTRWRHWLGVTLASLITADALVTLVEVLLFNVRQLHLPWELLVLAVAVLGPSTAAVFLWAAVFRQARLEQTMPSRMGLPLDRTKG